jgi:hypothetical protein
MAHRFQGIDISSITLENHEELLPESLIKQVEMFLPPSGSFDDGCLRQILRKFKKL